MKRAELMSETGNSLAGNQYPALTGAVCAAEGLKWRRKREKDKKRRLWIAIGKMGS